jgi:uncharacterized protein (DUF305 family)
VVVVAAVALVGVAVVGLRSATPAAKPEPTSETGRSSPVPVIVPGRPGEPATVLPAEAVPAPDGSRYNAQDVQFVRLMIPHHTQALEMAALAPSRAASSQIRAIAERIGVAQEAEIEVLRAWLTARGLDESGDGHSHSPHPHDEMPGMPGMQSPEDVQALASATGDAFDEMFVDLMSDHHQGAIDMAVEVLSLGVDERIQDLATAIAAEQSAEIGRLRDALTAS